MKRGKPVNRKRPSSGLSFRKVRRSEPRNHEAMTNRRLFILGGAASLGASVLLARLAQLQLAENERFGRKAFENAMKRELIAPRRGEIYDRFGSALATHKHSWRIALIPEETDDLEAALAALADIVPLTRARDPETRTEAEAAHIDRLIERARRQPGFLPLVVRSELTYEDFTRVSFALPDLEGVRAEAVASRSYPNHEAFAHVLGYVARANEEDVETEPTLAHPDMRVGRSGVEARADGWLRGDPGERFMRVNARGRVVGEINPNEIDPALSAGEAPRGADLGGDVILTLDAELQQMALEALRSASALEAEQSGAAIVMDVHTGDLLVFCSSPAFDPNLFVNGYPSAAFQALLDDQRHPLHHKAYDGLYPPGSVFKMVVALAALEKGVLNPNERHFCTGRYPFGGRIFHCWKREGHGSVNLREAMKGSCDTYFYEMAHRAGPQAIADTARMLGYGERFDLGITGGREGIVPDPEWKRRVRDLPWHPGETLNFGIGQGALLASPLQMAVMTARLANGGGAVIPRLYLQGPEDIVSASRTPEALPLKAEHLALVKDSMVAVTSDAGGTAARYGDLGVAGARQAGKTGTAQVRRITMAERATGVIANEDLPWRRRDHALFVGYAPIEAPRYACAVVVEHGGSGSTAAAPVAHQIMRAVIERDPAAKPTYQLSQANTEPTQL